MRQVEGIILVSLRPNESLISKKTHPLSHNKGRKGCSGYYSFNSHHEENERGAICAPQIPTNLSSTDVTKSLIAHRLSLLVSLERVEQGRHNDTVDPNHSNMKYHDQDASDCLYTRGNTFNIVLDRTTLEG